MIVSVTAKKPFTNYLTKLLHLVKKSRAFIWKPENHYCIHNGKLSIHILSQINPIAPPIPRLEDQF